MQVPKGGGSLVALYEMLRVIDTSRIEPFILCYYKNKFSSLLETVAGCKVIYLFNTSPEVIYTGQKKYGLLQGFILGQYNALKKYLLADKKVILQLEKTITALQPDIIHHNNDVILNREAIRAAKKLGIPQIIHSRSLTSYGNNFVNYFFDFFLIRAPYYRINITEAVRKHFDDLFFLSSKRSIVLHDFVDQEKFKPQPRDASTQDELEITAKDFVITNIARIIPWKGQDVLVKAINSIQNILPAFKVLIIGSAENGLGSDDYLDYLKDLAKKFNLEDKIIFTGHRDDIAKLINISDVIVHTATKPEPQGLIIVETLLCQKPLIATNAGGAAELVEKYGGILTDPSNATELADALLKVVFNKQDSISGHHPLRFEKLSVDFSPHLQMQQIMKIYSLIKPGKLYV